MNYKPTANDVALYTAYFALKRALPHIPREKGQEDGGYEVWNITEAMKKVLARIKVRWAERTQQAPTSAEPIEEDNGDHLSMHDWIEAVNLGAFVDNDGYGELATKDSVYPITVAPSDITVLQLPMPTWATHVMWYNK